MQVKSENKMGTAPIGKLLATMSLPAIFSMLVQALYNIVDSMFVAQINEDALTAVSLVYPIQILLIAVAIGTAVGVNSLISRRLGERHFAEANDAAEHGIFLGILNWLLFVIIGVFLAKPIMNAFTSDQVVANMGISYLKIITICSFGVCIEASISKTLQATGNMLYPMITQLIGAITNIILDPLMIFGIGFFPKMGVAGAAIATVIGQILALCFSIYALKARQHEVTVKLREFRPKLSVIKNIYVVGLPSIIMQAIMSILVSALNGILILFSKTAVAFYGVYYKLQSFVFMPVFGLTQGAMPIMGYNYGARRKKRLIQAIQYTLIVAACIMAIGTLIFQLFPRQLLSIFNASKDMYAIGVPALRVMSYCFVFAALGITISTLFQAIGQGFKSMLLSIFRQLAFILPIAYIFAKYVGLNAVWYSFIIAEFLTFLIGTPWMIFTLKKKFAAWEKEKAN